jgi:aspartyl-tRNA(Asn)/glutamyl-tRNA(Gln) amidotransferase subunit C
MTGIDDATVKKLARLARLALTDAEVRALVPELAGIVRYVDSLRAIDTAGVAPMIHGHPPGAQLHTPSPPAADEPVLGRTAVSQSVGFDDNDGTVTVPKVIE